MLGLLHSSFCCNVTAPPPPPWRDFPIWRAGAGKRLWKVPLRGGGGKRSLKLPAGGGIETEMAGLQKIGAHLIASCEPDYPEALAAIEDAPPVIAVRGQVSLLHKRTVGIVGARNASLNGRKM